MTKILKPLLLVLLAFAFTQACNAQQNFLNITFYRVYYGWAHNYPQDWLILRRFENNGKDYLLMINPQTLQSKVDESSLYQIKPMTLDETRTFFKSTPYEKAISTAEKQSVNIQD